MRTGGSWHSPGHVFSLGPVRLFQAQFGENPHKSHDGHYSTDDVNYEVRLVFGVFPNLFHFVEGRLPGLHPQRGVVILAGALVQPRMLEGAAEAEATGAAAVQIIARFADERRVPLAHHVVVTPTVVLGVRGLLRHALLPGAVGSGDHDESPQKSRLPVSLANESHKFEQQKAQEKVSPSHCARSSVRLHADTERLGQRGRGARS